MPIPLGSKHLPGFDQPVDLLSDCHRRIENFLGIMLAVCERAAGDPGGALGVQDRQALEAALTYFRTAAPRHTEDEERSLFPRMRQTGDERVARVLAEIDALEADHRTAEAAHAEVDGLGARWLAEGRLPAEGLGRMTALLRELRALYERHIGVEDTRVFPLAREVLGAEAVAAVGREMAERRGVKAPCKGG